MKNPDKLFEKNVSYKTLSKISKMVIEEEITYQKIIQVMI